MQLEILLVEDEPTLLLTLGDALEEEGHCVTRVADGDEAAAALGRGTFDLLVTDVRLPGRDGQSLAELALAGRPRTEVILMTAFGEVERAVGLIKRGALDYLCKPFDEELLLASVRKLAESLAPAHVGQPGLIAVSAEMKRLLRMTARVAQSDVPVVIQGETGVGKEVLARYLHLASRRRQEAFVAVNCAAVAPELIDSELFGHERGAFTGAVTKREGWLRTAMGGSLFLDEVAELPAEAQAKLLRALEDRTIRPVGSDKTIDIDIRLIAATNRDLFGEVERGNFRKDLLYRLETFELHIPPLRERVEDIVPLAEHFARKSAPDASPSAATGFRVETRAALLAHSWPGNVRELRNTIDHAMVLAGSPEEIVPSMLPRRLVDALPTGEPMNLRDAVRRVELDQARKALLAADGKKVEAARLLGVSRKHLWELLKRAEEE